MLDSGISAGCVAAVLLNLVFHHLGRRRGAEDKSRPMDAGEEIARRTEPVWGWCLSGTRPCHEVGEELGLLHRVVQGVVRVRTLREQTGRHRALGDARRGSPAFVA